MTLESVALVLFDLDGTLLDTAPDMVGTINKMRAELDLAPLPVERLRNAVNGGAVALIRAGMPATDDDTAERWRLRFLDLYGDAPATNTRLFPGMEGVLSGLEQTSVAWGVVTNKMHRFTVPVLEATGLAARCATIVSGDTAPRSKPHPAPVLHACAEADVQPEQALMVGDAERDIAAGRAAGTRTCAVTWGYIEPEDDPTSWRADYVVDDPKQLLGSC